jgi:O-antigen ligase
LALVVTGSFATVLALFVGVLATRSKRLLVPALVCGALLAIPLMSRDPRAALAGRVYLVEVALPHVAEAPLTGLGPGAVERHWPSWELAYWKARCDDEACVNAHPKGRFAGLQDHVHADWLEWLLERGVLGLAALGFALGAPLLSAWRSSPLVFAALVAALTRSLVDFPLERPADLAVLAFLCALAWPRVSHEPSTRGPSSTSSDRPDLFHS